MFRCMFLYNFLLFAVKKIKACTVCLQIQSTRVTRQCHVVVVAYRSEFIVHLSTWKCALLTQQNTAPTQSHVLNQIYFL